MPRPPEPAAGTGRPGRGCRFTNDKVDAHLEKREVEKPLGCGLQNRQNMVVCVFLLCF